MRYRNPRSGVRFFEIGDRWIGVWFADGACYTYDGDKPGLRHVEAMQSLARRHEGLATYISRFVRDNYASKTRNAA